MADTLRSGDLAAADDGLGAKGVPAKRRRRGLRITLLSLASVIVLLGAVAAGSFAYINHEVGSIPRIQVKFLAQDVPSGGMTILLTDAQVGPTGLTPAQASGQASDQAGLIMLLHINAGDKAGGAVSIPPQTMVKVPGRGEMQIQYVVAVGGPSLLVETVKNLTGVAINHYARIDFTHVASMVDAEGGVSVTLPQATESFGHLFHAGVNQVNGVEALEYARDPSLTETGRVLRQQSLTRTILDKLGSKHLLTSPLTMNRVLNALKGMLTVDSSFTNSQVESLATDLGNLTGGAGTFVTAPTRVTHGSVVLKSAESSDLWSAINSGSIAAFAKKYPGTVTPAAP
jgi:LCP family protein required for cell wall assembly